MENTLKELNDFKAKGNSKVQVVTVQLGADKDAWKANFSKYNTAYQWINLWAGNGQSKLKMDYDLTTTPKVFLLNEFKDIELKQISINQIEEIVK